MPTTSNPSVWTLIRRLREAGQPIPQELRDRLSRERKAERKAKCYDKGLTCMGTPRKYRRTGIVADSPAEYKKIWAARYL